MQRPSEHARERRPRMTTLLKRSPLPNSLLASSKHTARRHFGRAIGYERSRHDYHARMDYSGFLRAWPAKSEITLYNGPSLVTTVIRMGTGDPPTTDRTSDARGFHVLSKHIARSTPPAPSPRSTICIYLPAQKELCRGCVGHQYLRNCNIIEQTPQSSDDEAQRSHLEEMQDRLESQSTAGTTE